MYCVILTGCGYNLKVVKPETPSTEVRTITDNSKPFNEEFVKANASDVRYLKEDWAAAAKYLYEKNKITTLHC